MRTLIVEDSFINQEFLKMILEPYGECTVTESGEDALENFVSALQGNPFDIVFMDIMLPGMDGLQTLEHFRAAEAAASIHPDQMIKAIVTTALDDDDVASRAYIHGQALSYITKPIRQDKVETELKNFGFID